MEAGAAWRSERSRTGGVDRVPVPGVDGELWLCGKHFIGPDVEAAVARVGADVVLCLNERHELDDRYPDYVAWLAAAEAEADGRAWWFPIPDLHAPSPPEALEFLSRLGRLLRSGRSILMHCGAGMGRAGTMAAGLLMVMGATRTEAIGTIARARPLAGPEAGAQAALLEALSEALSLVRPDARPGARPGSAASTG